tara:strand:+ start:3971 stop:5926 length:1956 start_codon:yes stop_codon:yes gene_type:complete
MKYKYIIFLSFFSLVLGQASIDDLKMLSNAELDIIKSQLGDKASLDVDNKQLLSEDATESIESKEIFIPNNLSSTLDINFFGYSYFKKDLNFYDNIPTPSDFKLGPGDEIVLSLWGETNSRERFTINKEGLIYYENIGFINISNKTLEEAESILVDELSRIYSTLKNSGGSTNLMLELGKLKSVNVYFSGETKNPGINLVHPFSDIFTAISQVGIKETGSLRNIELIRNNKVYAKFDFYTFFINGKNNFSNIRILDGDIIHIPVVSKRVSIAGEIARPTSYELVETDSFLNLIDYAGGLNAAASNKAIIKDITPFENRISDDMARTSFLVNISLSSDVILNNGASVNVIPISDNDTDVTILGRVVLPGQYPAFKMINSSNEKQIKARNSLRNVLDLAGGFDDPIFRKTINDNIVVLRLDETQFYSKEFQVNYADSDKFFLVTNDKIFVYENPNYYNDFTFSIEGEINRPGTYPLRKGLRLSEAIKLAGGITEMGSLNSLLVSKNLSSLDELGNEVLSKQLVSNVDLDFEITDGNIIKILSKTNVVKVDGNVYSPGLIAHSGDAMSMSRAIELAGGYKPHSLKKRAYVIRANGEIERANILRGRAKRVFPGDSVFVPVNPDPTEFEITTFVSDLSTTLANIAAIFILIDNND